ncbi:SN protein, partial [Rhinopomastus cyanomelas]|nr:SN protein [Rhinopomastus cyanomelas]
AHATAHLFLPLPTFPSADPPRNLQMKTFMESNEGTTVILVCTVKSNPLSQLTLLKDGQLMVSSPIMGGDPHGQSIQVSTSLNALRLELREASEEDEGEYECRAHSPLGSAHMSLPLHIRAVTVVVRPSNEVAEGTDVTLTCQDMGAHPGTLYTWYKNGRWLVEGFDASFALPGAQRRDAGAYSCQARRGLRGRQAPPVILRILYAPQEPTFISMVEPQGGQQAVLHCTVDSFPPSDITLYRVPSHTPLASNPRVTVHVTPNSLRVEMVRLELRDAGVYVCLANNSYGTASSSLHLDVGGVTVTIEPSSEVPEGTSATMTCLGVPWVGDESNYTWYKNSRWLQDGLARTLILTRVSSADTGSYHCQASGTQGSVTSVPLNLNVLCECPLAPWGQAMGQDGDRPLLLHVDPPRDVSISTFLENRNGRVGIILCATDSHPMSTITLYHHGHLLASSLAPAATSQGVLASPSHNRLRVELGAVGPGVSGEYICMASNPLGNATASAYFDVSTLTHLKIYTVMAGLLIAVIFVSILTLLALKMWPR